MIMNVQFENLEFLERELEATSYLHRIAFAASCCDIKSQ